MPSLDQVLQNYQAALRAKEEAVDRERQAERDQLEASRRLIALQANQILKAAFNIDEDLPVSAVREPQFYIRVHLQDGYIETRDFIDADHMIHRLPSPDLAWEIHPTPDSPISGTRRGFLDAALYLLDLPAAEAA